MEDLKDSYRSVSSESRGVFRDKASRFISIAMPVGSEEEVKQELMKIRKAYHDANHHCYAYKLGPEDQAYRFNDDGEPSGSAGRPIYGQILSSGLSDVLVVVIRYFGGTKLGVPGLINAYKTAAREALAGATIIEKVVRVPFTVICSYEVMNDVMRILKEEQARITSQHAMEACEITFLVRKGMAGRVEERLKRLKIASLS